MLEFLEGQYWVTGDDLHLTLVGFILEVNEHAVIFQKEIKEDPIGNDVVFNFEAGQELVTKERFDSLVQRLDARLLSVNKNLIDQTLKTYKQMKASKQIAGVTLPKTPQEATNLLNIELVKYLKNIVCPPIEYINVNGCHWLTNGAVSRLLYWNKDALNWTDMDGIIDHKGSLSFKFKYHKPAHKLDISQNDKEGLLTKLKNTLVSWGYILNQSKLNKAHEEIIDCILKENEDQEEVSFVLDKEHNGYDKALLMVVFNNKVYFKILYTDIKNGEYIDVEPTVIRNV